MKKSIFICVAFLCLIGFKANAQRHIKGIKAIDVMGGLSGKGSYGELGYAHYLNNKFYITVRGRYEKGTINDSLNFTTYGLNVGANYTLWNPGEGFFFNLCGGGTAQFNQLDTKSYDRVKINDGIKQNTQSYGLFGGVETEVFFGNRVVWLLNFRQNVFFNKSIGSAAFYAGTGLRFNIY